MLRCARNDRVGFAENLCLGFLFRCYSDPYNHTTFKNVATEGSLYEQAGETQAVRTAQQNVRDLMNEVVALLNEDAA